MIFLDTSILSLAYRKKYKTDVVKPVEVMMLQQMVIGQFLMVAQPRLKAVL